MAKDLIFTILGIDKASPAFKKVAKSAEETGQALSRAGSIGTKAMLAMPAAAAGAGAAVAGSMGLITAGMIGMAAIALRNNEQVAASFGLLGDEISENVRKAAEPMADEFVSAANQMRATADKLAPSLIKMASAAQPAVKDLTAGITGLAENAMPGFVTAVERSGAVTQGFRSMLQDTGTGVSSYFTNLSAGAESSGQIIKSTGHMVRDFGGFAGALFAQLANSGSPAVRSLEGFMRQLEGTVLSLGGTAFPGLANAASGFLAAGSGVLRLLQLIMPVVGPLIPMIANFAASLKLIDMVSFGAVSAGLGAVKTAVGEADGAGNKLKAGLGALASGPLPILGVAAVALGFVLDGLGKKQREAAEAAAYHDKLVRDLKGTLDETTGAVTDRARKEIAGKVATDKFGKASRTLADISKDMGINTEYVTGAVVNQNNELKSLDGGLRGSVKATILASGSQQDLQKLMARTGKSMDDLVTVFMGGAGGVDEFQKKVRGLFPASQEGSDAIVNMASKMQEGTLNARDLWGGVTALNTGLSGAQKEALQAAQALGLMTPAQREAKAKADALKASLDILGDATKTVAEKGQAMIDMLDRLSGKQPDMREAEQAWNDLMRSLTKATDWDAAAAGVQKLHGGLVDMKGEVNTTTEAGSRLQDWARQSAVDFGTSAAAMKAAGIPAGEMTTKLDAMRQQFINNAIAQGLPREAAIRLADAYHLVPSQVVTAMTAPGLLQRMTELGILHHQIVSLPEGRFSVIANTDAARGTVTKLVTDFNGKVITLRVQTTGASAGLIHNQAGGRDFFASGTDFAPGGLAVVGEEGPEVVELPRGSKVHDALESKRMMSGSGSPITATRMGGNTYVLNVYNAGNSEINLREQFRRMELMDV